MILSALLLTSCGHGESTSVSLSPSTDVATRSVSELDDPVEASLVPSWDHDQRVSLATTSVLLAGLKRPYGIAFDGSNFVVAEFGFSLGSSGLRVISPGGSQIAFLAAGQVGRLRGVAVEGSDYLALDGGFGTPGQLFRVPMGGGSPSLISGDLGVAISVAVIDPGVYAVTDGFNTGRLLRVEQGIPPQVIAGNLGFAYGVAVEDPNTYIVTDVIGGRLLRVTSGGAVTELLTTGLDQPRGVKVESPGVYLVADFGTTPGSGRVLRVTPANMADPIEVVATGVGNPADVVSTGAAQLGITDFPGNRTFLFDEGALVVNTLDDQGSDDDTPNECSLREAITASTTGAPFEGCQTPSTTILFEPGLMGTITLTSTLSIPGGTVVVEGPGRDQIAISGNNARRVIQVQSGATVTLEGLTIANGSSSGNGGGILNQGTLTLVDSTVSGNFSGDNGGGIFQASGADPNRGLTVTRSTLDNNQAAGYGGAIYQFNQDKIEIHNSTISNNSASEIGGIGARNVEMIESWITGNRSMFAFGTAGGFLGEGTIDRSTISGNSAYGGGGISSFRGTLTISNSTISRNDATRIGGGLNIGLNSQITLINSTVSGNSIDNDGGSGVYVREGTLESINSTFSGNNNSFGSDPFTILNDDGLVSLTNTLIVRNLISFPNSTSNPACGSRFFPGQFITNNVLLDEGSCGAGSTVDPDAGDPAFLDITRQANGTTILTGDPHTGTVPLRTHALLSGHPGIDQGNNSLAVEADGVTPLTTDQRGFPRVVNGTVDIGSFELQ